jgi:hypothetical protein
VHESTATKCIQVFKSIVTQHAGLLQALSPSADGSVIHSLLKVFEQHNHNEQALRQSEHYKQTVVHSVMNVFVEGDTELRLQGRKIVRHMYETAVSQACTAQLTRVHEASLSEDFLVQMSEMEKTMRSFYAFK